MMRSEEFRALLTSLVEAATAGKINETAKLASAVESAFRDATATRLKEVADAVSAGALQLRQDTHTRGKNAYREVGVMVPDFAALLSVMVRVTV